MYSDFPLSPRLTPYLRRSPGARLRLAWGDVRGSGTRLAVLFGAMLARTRVARWLLLVMVMIVRRMIMLMLRMIMLMLLMLMLLQMQMLMLLILMGPLQTKLLLI